MNKVENIISNHIYVNQTYLVEQLLLEHFEIENLFTEEEEPKDIYEWWCISDWLADNIKNVGGVILDCEYGKWWGREETGLSLIYNNLLQEITNRT